MFQMIIKNLIKETHLGIADRGKLSEPKKPVFSSLKCKQNAAGSPEIVGMFSPYADRLCVSNEAITILCFLIDL